jgi:NADPH-dependent glutamate synthase beta subunit-like oxidoreductase
MDRVVAYGEYSHKCPIYLNRMPPCQNACPAGEDIRGYNNILRGVEKFRKDGSPIEDRYAEAFYRIAERNPFPAVMGRVCPAVCQTKCNRKDVDDTVGINSIEHAIGDYALEKGLKLPGQPGPDTGKHIAIVGGGFSGLSAAYNLRKMGHKVTIYEGQAKLGGMVRYGIMGYRVDRVVMDKEIARILEFGMEIKYNQWIGKDVTLEQLRKDHDAVFIAIGAQKGRNIPIPGYEDAKGATNAIKFLMEYERDGVKAPHGSHVVVIGDGNVAMDVARLALRLGSKSSLVSGVPADEMNCFPEELHDAQTEGAEFHYQVGTKEVLKDDQGNVRGLKCVKMQKKEKGEDGWNHAVPFLRYKEVPGSEFEIKCDMVVAAIGQMTDTTGFGELPNNNGLLKVDHNMQVTGKGNEDLFAGGDILQIDLITTAIGQGRVAAEAMDKFVSGVQLPSKHRTEVIGFDDLKSEYFRPSTRAMRGHNFPKKVEGDFNEVLLKLENEQVNTEVERCMSCGLCFECKQCMLFCPQEAIEMFRKNPIGEVMFTDYTKCVGCHICAETCPTGYIKMGMGDDL